MCIMEKELENEVLSGEVELDETFVESSRKSLAAEEDAGFGVVAERVKRGLSKQKVCIASGVDGSGNAFAHAYNCGQFGQTAALSPQTTHHHMTGCSGKRDVSTRAVPTVPTTMLK